MQDFRNLKVWQKSLTLLVYRATESMPQRQNYGLTSQIRRASSSIAANIAARCGRGSDPDLKRFLQMAIVSASELDYHLLLARDLGYISADTYGTLAPAVAEVMRMLSAFIVRLRTPDVDQQLIANS